MGVRDLSGMENGEVDHLLDRSGQSDVGLGGEHHIGDGCGDVHPVLRRAANDAEKVHEAGRRQPLGDLFHLIERQSTSAKLIAGDTHADDIVAPGHLADFLEHFHTEP